MPAMSSGRLVSQPQRVGKKSGTASAKNHQFQSFSQRIAKLNIDPVRRVRQHNLDEDNQQEDPYFKIALERWDDKNLSGNYAEFVRRATPLCGSLPQLLHSQDQIMDLLIEYIGKRDALSLEPLLDLLAQFAHDLGTRFEKDFARVVTLVASIAAKHTDLAVVEWSFNCLAWLFKYLSRLLVPDLRPLYDLMAPLLGREKQRYFVSTFAAESMTFLMRAAAKNYHKNKSWLCNIITYSLNDLLHVDDASNIAQYQQALMTLYADAIKGVNRGINSNGQAIFRSILATFRTEGEADNALAEEVVHGVLVNLIHHTDAESFSQISSEVFDFKDEIEHNPGHRRIRLYSRLLFITAAVRKGSRILVWEPLLEGVSALLRATVAEGNNISEDIVESVFRVTALVLQSSPFDSVIPYLRNIFDVVCSDSCIKHFLPFCNYSADLGRERFQSLVLPHFQKFIVTHWSHNEDELCVLIRKLSSTGCISIAAQSSSSLSCPTAWQRYILEQYPQLTDSPNPLQSAISCQKYLIIFRLLSFDRNNHSRFQEMLHQHLELGLRSQSVLHEDAASLIFTQGFESYVESSRGEELDTALWSPLCQQASIYARHARHLHALMGYITALSEHLDFSMLKVAPLVGALTENLKGASHELRSQSLRILDTIYTNGQHRRSETLATALLIAETPLELNNARSISMRVRKLASSYESAASDFWLKRVVPYFCFGLLTEHFTQLWHDSCDALAVMSQIKEGEEIVAGVAFEWLQDLEVVNDSPSQSTEFHKSKTNSLTRFECSNLNEVQLLARQSVDQIAEARETLRVEFVRDANSVPLSSPMKRSQALRVLSNIPNVAEKNSRQLVPILLDWATSRDYEAASATIGENASDARNITNPRWCRKDQKDLLGLFAQFVNPTVLYKSTEVFRALLALLSHGDVDIQRSALKAIFTWNSPSILPYKENLLNILDDARFREEISVFIHVNEEDSMMQQNHRQELMPILLRLLYGKIVAKGGSTSGRSGQKPKRKAVLEALARFGPQELDEFIQIALGPLNKIQLFKSGTLQNDILAAGPLSLRKQLGLVNMLEDMLETLGTRLHPFITSLLDPLLYCLTGASRGLSNEKGRPAEESDSVQVSLLKAIRQVGCKCLSFLFSCFPDFDWRPYMPAIFCEIVNPRLERLSIETAQSVSGLLQLFSTWSTSYNTACFLVRYNKELLTKVSECLAVPSAKDEVKLFILDKILKKILELAVRTDNDEDSGHHGQAHVSVPSEILQPNLDNFLVRVGGLLRGNPTKDVLRAGVQVISQLGPFITRSSEAKNLVDISIFLLDQPSQRVSPKTKSELLQILQHFLPLYDIHGDQNLQSKVLRTVSSLFGYFKDRNSREVLSQVLTVYAQTQPELLQVAKLCIKLNAFSPKRLDEPDFDQRREAFKFINEDGYKTFSITQWRPILYNALFYIKDNEELAIRLDASVTLRRLIESSEGHSTESDFIKELISSILLPSLRKGMHESSELVRKEYTDVVAHLVKHQPNWTEVSNMRSLLVEDHEEATFFENILHVQQPCRMRALRQLAKNVQQGLIQSNNISHLFIPLIEHFIFNKAEDEISNNLAAETINTIGIIVEGLEWQQFRAILRRYSSYINTKPDLEKTVIKLLSSVIGGLGRAAERDQTSFGLPNGTTESTNYLSAQGQIVVKAPSRRSTLALTIPKQDKLAEDLVKNLLPPLMGYLHNKDESTVSLRVPVAVSIVKLLKLLPSDQLSKHLPPVLTDVCHILRSKSQDARDMTRKTLAEIAALTGPSCFGFMLRELKSSLERGYQLHVLSFTVHSILVSTASIFKPGDIDYCLPQIVSIIRNDIFGDTGEEKDAGDYISRAKEVKSSKSYDSMELVARTAALSHLGSLVNPISELLQEKLTIKLVQKIDELLRRVMVGILRNDAVRDHRILKFCHEIIKAIYETNTINLGDQNKEERTTQRFLIDIKGAKGAGVRRGTTSYDYKMVQFALNLLRSVLQKHDHLKTSYYLTDFMPIIGDAMLSPHEDVQISALRLLTTIIKVPIPEIAKSAKVYIAESVKMIRGCSSTNTEVAQAALKLISAILRERPDVNTTAADINHIRYLLKRLKPDLSEPDRQGVTFNFLRAIITRKVNIPEIYEVIDTVAEIMVTNYSRGARDLARGAYFQFFMEYEQTQHRVSKQLGFLVQNLEYPYQEGRQSVLEALHLLLTKVPDAMAQEIMGTVFIPLVMVLVNDESVSCREMAAALLKEAFQRADGDRTQTFLSLIRTWLGKDERSMLTRVALQCYSIYYEIHGSKGRKELPSVQTHLLRIMHGSFPGAESRDWEILYFALHLTASLCQNYPSKMLAPSSAMLWEAVETCVSFPHAWVKVAAARLIGLYFADFARTNAESGLQSVPLEGSEGLQLNKDEMLRLTSTSLRVLRVPGVSEELATQTVRNLVFLGRCFGVNGLRWQQSGRVEGMNEFDEEIEEEVVDEVASAGGQKSALTYLFERLSAILRRESITTRAPSLVSKTASLQLLSTLCNNLPPSSLLGCLQTILLPLHNLTDPSIPSPYSTDEAFMTTYKVLVSASHEILELIKKKFGPTEYTSQMSRVRKGVKERREGRRIKRRIEAVATPEKLGREKKRRGEKKREKRKERSGEERSRRRGW